VGFLREFLEPKINLNFFRLFWLRGVDLNHRPLGYERPEISVSIGQQGTSGHPEIPLGTAGTAPFVATLIDVNGIVIYLTVAKMVLSGTLL
jgi:hypothetical protein